jgi:hypothetical protein
MKKLTVNRKLLWLLYVGGALLLLVAGLLWWSQQRNKPEAVFWRMIDQSLATRAVAIDVEQSGNGSNIKQTVQYSLGAQNISHSLTVLKQAGTTVKNETIGTQTADYTRYADIKTDQKKSNGQPLDTSKILGVWAKSDGKSDQTGAGAKVFTQSVLGTGLPLGGVAVPIGNLRADQREQFIDQIRDSNVYSTNFNKAEKRTVDGRLRYVYDVNVQPVAYAALMKGFAKHLGLHDLDQLDPNAYQGQQSTHMLFTVDAMSGHLLSAVIKGSDYTQTYRAYDIPVSIELPKKTISLAELQSRLSELQQ